MRDWEEQLQKDVYQKQHLSLYQNQLSEPLIDNEIGNKSQNMCFDSQFGVVERVNSMEIVKCHSGDDDKSIEEEPVPAIQEFKYSGTPMTPREPGEAYISLSS